MILFKEATFFNFLSEEYPLFVEISLTFFSLLLLREDAFFLLITKFFIKFDGNAIPDAHLCKRFSLLFPALRILYSFLLYFLFII